VNLGHLSVLPFVVVSVVTAAFDALDFRSRTNARSRRLRRSIARSRVSL